MTTLDDIKIALPHLTVAALVNYQTLDPKKPTLVFLHGYLDNADSFARLLPFFEAYQCIAIDMAGHGKSAHRSADAHYHISDYAFDVYQLVNTLCLTNFVLIGHSLGAIVSSLYASTNPMGLRAFVAIESCGPLSQSEQTTASQLTECFVSRANTNKPIKHPESLDAVVKLRVAVSDLNHDQALQIMRRNLHCDDDGKWRWRTDKRLRTKSAMRMTEGQANAVLSSVKCPRIVILGNQGFEKVKTGIAQRKKAFKDVQIYYFEGGHHVHLDSAKEVAHCIHEFVSQCFISHTK